MNARLFSSFSIIIATSLAFQSLSSMPIAGQSGNTMPLGAQNKPPMPVVESIKAPSIPITPLNTVPSTAVTPSAPRAAISGSPSTTPTQSTSPAATLPLASPAAIPSPVSTPAPAIVGNAGQLKELEDALSKIEQTKQNLTKLLQELDEKLLDARKKAAEAKTLNTNLLTKQEETQAKADYEKIREASKSVQATQEFVQSDFSKNFNDKIAEFKVLTTKAENILKNINTQKPTPTSPATPPIIPPTTTQSATRQEPQSGVWNSITSSIAAVVGSIKNLFGDNEPPKKKTESVEVTKPIPANPTQRANEASVMVRQMDQYLQSLDATRNTIQQYITTINQNSTYIETLAKQGSETTQLLTSSKKAAVQVVEPTWKKISMRIISKILDGVGYVVSGLYNLIDNTIGKFTRNLIKDVKNKVAANETPKTTPGAA